MCACASASVGKLSECRRCPRLVSHLDTIRDSHPDYHCRPVGQWGDPRARLLVVGLAPGLKGANRTGKAFVGDSSGRTLFGALHRCGYASSADPFTATLKGCRITNVLKCLPPGNRPTSAELRNCQNWLAQELSEFLRPTAVKTRTVLCLGRIAHDTVLQTLGLPRCTFTHGNVVAINRRHQLVASYHPSLQNVNTGRLTHDMLSAVFEQIRASD